MNLRLVSVAIALVLSAMLLGAGIYESVVVAPNFQGAPTSLEHARGFCHATNPGMFFRVLAPAVQLFLLLALLCNWKAPGTRWRLAGALLLAILADVITFKFHYPRNAILFMYLLAVRKLSKDSMVVSAQPTSTRHTQKSLCLERGYFREAAGMRSRFFIYYYCLPWGHAQLITRG